MHDATDMELLRDYARQNSEAAFAELVRRHINLVYSAALRQVGIAAQAEEIAQAVFIILARKAGHLREGLIFEAWLFETTRLTALSFLRGERRRQFREQEAYMQSTLQESTPDPTWQEFSPLLDEAMMRLARHEREAVVLRFFKEQSMGEVAAALNIKEPAAQMRVGRALDKLRRYFLRRGISSTTAIIAGAVSANLVHAAPAGLANTISAAAVAKGTVASASTLTLVKGALKLMAWTHAKTAIVVGVGILLAAGATTVVTMKEIHRYQNDEWQLAEMSLQFLSKPPYRTVILPTRSAERGRHIGQHGLALGEDGRVYGINASVEEMLHCAFALPQPQAPASSYVPISPVRTILNTELPVGQYDYFSNLPKGAEEALQREIRKKFGLSAGYQTIVTNVLLLEVKYPESDELKRSMRNNKNINYRDGEIHELCPTTDDLARFLEMDLGIPVINQTGLTGYHYFTLHWQKKPAKRDMNGLPLYPYENPNPDELKRLLANQLGLQLVSTNRPVEFLVVEKAK